MGLKEDYQEKLEAQLKEWSAKISDLKAKADQASADVKIKMSKEIDDLKVRKEAAQQKLTEIKAAGAEKVIALDVGRGQLDSRLRGDPRVHVLEKVNARYLTRTELPYEPDLLTMDVSFISVLKVFPALRDVLCPGGLLFSLLTPQFEAERGQIGKRGVVRDPDLHARVLRKIAEGAAAMGLSLRGFARCSTRGRKGNREFFGLWSEARIHPPHETVLKWIEEVTRDEND